MSQANQLKELQKTDDQIRQTQQRLEEIHTQLHDDAAVTAARSGIQQVKDQLQPLRTRTKDLELEIETTVNKAKETETLLYSGEVKNTKEMEDMQAEVTSLKERQERLEETMLDLMMEIETAEHDLESRETALNKLLTTRDHQGDALTAERSTRENELAQFQATRERIRESIEAEHLRQYDRLQQRTRGEVVTRMSNDAICGKCGVQQNRAIETEVRRGNVAQCSNCQRILVF
jgi:predicted  nucleic acid-binding Zn-ribbon protein